MNYTICILLAVALGSICRVHAEGVEIFGWGPSSDFVRTNLVSQRPPKGGVIPFDLDVPITPVEGYRGTLFYAGIEAVGGGGLNAGIQIANNDAINGGGNDAVRFGRTAAESQPGDSVTGFFYWKRSDFAKLSESGLGDFVVSKLSYCGRINGRASFSEARFVVGSMGKYMISSPVALGATYSSVPLEMIVSPGMVWHNYNPYSGVAVIGAKIQRPNLSNVDGLGLFLTATSDGSGALSIIFSSFAAESAPLR